jgi:hypothetical protein
MVVRVVFDSLAHLAPPKSKVGCSKNNNKEDEIFDDEDDEDNDDEDEDEDDEDEDDEDEDDDNKNSDEKEHDDVNDNNDEQDDEAAVDDSVVDKEEEDNVHDENVDNDDDSKSNDSNDDNDDNDNDSYTPGDSDDDEGQKKVATASAHRLIPTTAKQRTSSVANLYTNGLDAPKYNQLHKAQQPVAADAPGFREALQNIVIPQEMMILYQTCVTQPKESFFLSALAHIQVISKACGLSTQEMIQIRGWVFLNKNSLRGAPYRYQSFADALYDTVMLGANDEVNYRNLPSKPSGPISVLGLPSLPQLQLGASLPPSLPSSRSWWF